MSFQVSRRNLFLGGGAALLLLLGLIGWFVARPAVQTQQKNQYLLESIAAHKDAAEAYKTIQETEKTKEKDRQNPGPYITIGNNWVLIADILQSQDARDEAIAEYERGVAVVGSKSTILLLNAGNAYRNSGRFEEAEAKYKMAIEADPGDGAGYERLVDLYRFSMQKTSADIIPVYQQALEKVFDNARIVQSLAEYLSAIGRLRDAVPYYQLLAKKYPEQFLPIIRSLEERLAVASSTPKQ
ncbi:tetratricopeptide repeat protein [Patescibacteria group bacterium]|nr:tetratricopeptide repeat protein [Patescibacteria group bacterium]